MINGFGHSLLRPWRMRAFALGAAAVAWLLVVLLAPVALQQADERAGDLVWRLSADTQAERRVVVVDIDDASLQRVGPWPWPRETRTRRDARYTRSASTRHGRTPMSAAS